MGQWLEDKTTNLGSGQFDDFKSFHNNQAKREKEIADRLEINQKLRSKQKSEARMGTITAQMQIIENMDDNFDPCSQDYEEEVKRFKRPKSTQNHN